MVFVMAVLLLPPLLIFGIYHLSLWFNLLGIRRMVFWRRVALTSVVAHTLLAAGFFAFSYLDYQANRDLVFVGQTLDSYLFNRSEFWSLMVIFDTLPTLTVLGLFALLDRFDVALPQLVGVTVAIVFLLGSFQWYWIGAGIGALFERIWAGLKGPGAEDGWP
jgi:hypothetical protein